MDPKKALLAFESLLKSRRPDDDVASKIIELAPSLPDAAIPMMDLYLDGLSPLVKVAVFDSYYGMTGCNYHIDDVEKIQKAARSGKKANEDVFAAATVALARQTGEPEDTWMRRRIQISGTRKVRKGVGKKVPRELMTIMIHGTWASNGDWWRPGGDFFDYVKKDLGLSDLYSDKKPFKWSGDNDGDDRHAAAEDLVRWMKARPADSVRVFAHSHGANVASLATRSGARFDQLVMLSPPVRKDYLPKWSNVGQAYNIQAKFDVVVGLARGGQWFKKYTRTKKMREKKLDARGHSSSHKPSVWKRENLKEFIGLPWD